MSRASFVLDNSVIIAWALGEGCSKADAVMDALAGGEARVPSVWPLEFGNAMVVAGRRGRLTDQDASRLCGIVMALPIRVIPDTKRRVISHVLTLARESGLSVYDASYLDLCLREELPLATLDGDLRRAARERQVPLLIDD